MKLVKKMLSNPQTTIAGLTSFLAGCATIGSMIKGATPITPESISTAGGLIATGVGLVLASDVKKVDNE